MKVIGLQSGHDCSYCILEDGIPSVHNELERFIRVKEPLDDSIKFMFDQESEAVWGDCRHFTHMHDGWKDGLRGERTPGQSRSWVKLNNFMRRTNGRFYEPGHHQAHAANAFFSTNYDEALIITIDGGGWESEEIRDDGIINGDFITTFTIWKGEGNKIYPIHRFPTAEVNIGSLWSKTTGHIFGLGMGMGHDKIGSQAGTVMGMAALGKVDEYSEYFTDAIIEPGLLDVHWPRDKEILKKKAAISEQESFNIALSLQNATEIKTKHLIDPYIKKYKPKHVVLAGGVVLNSVMVGKMYDWYDGIVDDFYVCPVPYDGGLAIGCAQFVYHQTLNNPRVTWENGYCSPYLGKTYDEKSIMHELSQHNHKIVTPPIVKSIVGSFGNTEIPEIHRQSKISLEYTKVTDQDVVDLLTKDNNVISVFGGGSESGRRALGNRSILADPRSPDMKDIINDKVKHRQWFRPFAPSILREDVSDWFMRDVSSPYMTTVVKFKDDVKDKVPAVVHFDGTARLQTVSEGDNKWYYNFIKKFKEKTGVPLLLNTSFNDREPIVETPAHAINCFLGTEIDYLYFFDINILVKRAVR